MISPKEVMRDCIVSYEGKLEIVKTIGQYIILEGWKEWIGGSLINPVPLTEEWLAKLGFQEADGKFYWADPITSRIVYVSRYKEDRWLIDLAITDHEPMSFRMIESVHQLQVSFFGIFGEHIKISKIK